MQLPEVYGSLQVSDHLKLTPAGRLVPEELQL